MRAAGVGVLIVGAGVAGLAAARTLRDWGADVEIVERTPGPATEGTGIYLPGNAVRALHNLGLGHEAQRRAVRIARQRFSDHRGRVLVDIDTSEVWSGVGDCIALHRATLHNVLLAGAGDVPIRWGVGPRAISPELDGVSVEFSDGTTGRHDLVLGADGIHSTVRRLLFANPEPRPVGQYARRFIVHQPDFPPVWSVLLGPGSSFLTIPIGDGSVYCYCDSSVDRPSPMRQLLSGYVEPVPTLLDALADAGDEGDSVHASAIEEVAVGRWSHGAVLLIGDAAHATSPNMAQGAAMALEDALVLAESLAAAGNVADALETYERRRRPRTDWVLRQTHRRDRTRGPPAIARNLLLRQFGQQIYRANYRPLLALP